ARGLAEVNNKAFPAPPANKLSRARTNSIGRGSMEPDPSKSPTGGSSSLIFLGTGCSGTLPDARCLLKPSTPPCAVCSMGISLPPEGNPNYRCAQYGRRR
uniref:Uncharacterized protein n=1 Tax=Aegilops tauschii subsp. strangulata TaxID=200361 RepID=A0A453SD86_AEGTS